ncbi:hypothetical protein Q8A73_014512 [Channa argus]|nr:hypothetical protein Q8A73_014512 [Channa argus]
MEQSQYNQRSHIHGRWSRPLQKLQLKHQQPHPAEPGRAAALTASGSYYETGLVSLGVTPGSVMLLCPHFLFVMAPVDIQRGVIACQVHRVTQCSTRAHGQAGDSLKTH